MGFQKIEETWVGRQSVAFSWHIAYVITPQASDFYYSLYISGPFSLYLKRGFYSLER